MRVLSESNLPRLASRCSDGTRGRLAALKFRDLVTGAEGEAVAAQLISTLVGQHMTSGGGRTEDLASILQVWWAWCVAAVSVVWWRLDICMQWCRYCMCCCRSTAVPSWCNVDRTVS